MQGELSATRLTEGLSGLHCKTNEPRNAGDRRCVVLLLSCSTWKGEPPARVRPLFSGAENSPTPALLKHGGISLTAVSDQGPCPWTLVAFVKAPQNLNGPAGLELCYGLRFTAPTSRSRPRSTAKSSPLSRSVRSHTPYTAVPRWSGRCIPNTALPPLPVWG